jgi:hypothetical protein
MKARRRGISGFFNKISGLSAFFYAATILSGAPAPAAPDFDVEAARAAMRKNALMGPEAQSNLNDALMSAAMSGNAKEIVQLVQKGADVNLYNGIPLVFILDKMGEAGWNIRHYKSASPQEKAEFRNNYDYYEALAEKMVQLGANVNIGNGQIMVAMISKARSAAVEFLVDHGFHLDLENPWENKDTLTQWLIGRACQTGSPEMPEALLKRCSDRDFVRHCINVTACNRIMEGRVMGLYAPAIYQSRDECDHDLMTRATTNGYNGDRPMGLIYIRGEERIYMTPWTPYYLREELALLKSPDKTGNFEVQDYDVKAEGSWDRIGPPPLWGWESPSSSPSSSPSP